MAKKKAEKVWFVRNYNMDMPDAVAVEIKSVDGEKMTIQSDLLLDDEGQTCSGWVVNASDVFKSETEAVRSAIQRCYARARRCFVRLEELMTRLNELK